MARQCKECSCVVEDEQAKNTYDEFGFPLCEKCVKDYLNNNNTQDQQSGQATNQEPLSDPAVLDIISDDNKPSVGLADPVKYPKPVKRPVQAVSIPGYTREQIETIKNTVAKGATDSELQMFIHVAEKYGLDPFLKEIYYSNEMHTILSSRDGYLKAAMRDPNFDGLQSMAVFENDDFSIDAAAGTVHHVFGKGDRGKIIGAWAIAFHKQRRPVIAFASFDEYSKNSSTWRTYKSAMICKVSESFVLKRQFSLSGLVTIEEVGYEAVE